MGTDVTALTESCCVVDDLDDAARKQYELANRRIKVVRRCQFAARLRVSLRYCLKTRKCVVYVPNAWGSEMGDSRRLALAVAVVATALAGSSYAGSSTATAAECANGAVLPAEDGTGTYSLCVAGQWTHLDRQLCVDYPTFAPHCTAAPATGPAPDAPPPVVAPPPVAVPPPAVAPPALNGPSVPGLGCTWVDGYTKKNGTRVRGHWRC